MLGNFVNVHDVRRLAGQLRRGRVGSFTTRLSAGRRRRIEQAWASVERPPTNWWDLPEVRRRWNRRVSGDPEVDACEHLARRHLGERRDLVGLSLGCGAGARELRWARTGRFRRLEAVDLSAARIAAARRRAAEEGLVHVLDFRVGDCLSPEGPEGRYDVVLAESILHHLSPLERAMDVIDRMLAPDGWLFVDDFVGPTRMQWTERQLEAINGLLAVLPARFRHRWDGATRKDEVVRPSRLSMILSDPSEAVESARILPLLRERFEVVELRELGGSLLHMLLSEIAHNFRGEEPEVEQALRLCFDAEDLLLASGELRSDFAVAACRKRTSAGDGARVSPWVRSRVPWSSRG